MYYLSEINNETHHRNKMRTKVYTLLMLLSITSLLCSCSKTGKSKANDGKPAVTVQNQQLSDNSGFTMTGGTRCTIVADASIDYPVADDEGMAVDSLQRLFAAYVLESGDSLSLQEAMRQVVANSMHQYDFMQEPVGGDEVDERDDEATLKYATSTRITPVYNTNGIVTFERVDVVKKNDKVTSVTHRYYSFDVKTQTLIDLSSLFRDDAVADVCQLLKQQLLTQNNATGNEQLNDLGYYNVENITVTRNFFFDDKGMTWSFLPNELAVEAVGEPRITIPYSELSDSKCDDSILDRLH